MVKYPTELKSYFLEANNNNISKIPKSKVRSLSQYIRRLKGYRIAKTKKGERYLLKI